MSTIAPIGNLCVGAFRCTLSFLEPKDLACLERTCRVLNEFIHSEAAPWKTQCQIQLGLSEEADPKPYLPESSSYKESLQLIFARIFDERIYQSYLGVRVGKVPTIPKEISLQKWNRPDPCNRKTKIGDGYFWVYCPADVEVNPEEFSLDKPDDPNNAEAPRLIRKKAEFTERTVGMNPEQEGLKVPLTINNIWEIFKHPIKGQPSTFNVVSPNFFKQHGNERIPAGWVCMRRNAIERNRSFSEQRIRVQRLKMVISNFPYRMLLNFLEHVRSGAANTYPDGETPKTHARTSATTGIAPSVRSFSCGNGNPSGLSVCHSVDADAHVGIAVELPVKARVVGS